MFIIYPPQALLWHRPLPLKRPPFLPFQYTIAAKASPYLRVPFSFTDHCAAKKKRASSRTSVAVPASNLAPLYEERSSCANQIPLEICCRILSSSCSVGFLFTKSCDPRILSPDRSLKLRQRVKICWSPQLLQRSSDQRIDLSLIHI